MDYVLKELENATKELEKIKNASLLCPEVQINFVYAKENAKNIKDVAGFPGRIVRVWDTLKSFTKPAYGASKHVAKALLVAMQYNAEIRSCMNIKYDKGVEEACKKAGFKIASFDRRNEPEEIKKVEGKSTEWGVSSAIEGLGYVPDVIFDYGDFGKEPITFIFGKNPKDVLRKFEKILAHYINLIR